MAVPSSKEELIKAINSNFSLLNKKLLRPNSPLNLYWKGTRRGLRLA